MITEVLEVVRAMDKKPTCPYCGAEMINAGVYAWYWFSCPKCRAESPRAGARSIALTMASRRADILRAEWCVYDDEYDQCSNCSYLHPQKGPDGLDTACSYCPECGAKMQLPEAPKEG